MKRLAKLEFCSLLTIDYLHYLHSFAWASHAVQLSPVPLQPPARVFSRAVRADAVRPRRCSDYGTA